VRVNGKDTQITTDKRNSITRLSNRQGPFTLPYYLAIHDHSLSDALVHL